MENQLLFFHVLTTNELNESAVVLASLLVCTLAQRAEK